MAHQYQNAQSGAGQRLSMPGRPPVDILKSKDGHSAMAQDLHLIRCFFLSPRPYEAAAALTDEDVLIQCRALMLLLCSILHRWKISEWSTYPRPEGPYPQMPLHTEAERWACQPEHWGWLLEYAYCCYKQYALRYGKQHAGLERARWCAQEMRSLYPVRLSLGDAAFDWLPVPKGWTMGIDLDCLSPNPQVVTLIHRGVYASERRGGHTRGVDAPLWLKGRHRS